MARTVANSRLASREQRLRLASRKEPYWMGLNEGEHLGYYRGVRIGKWVARFRPPGAGQTYQQKTLGEADDTVDADGTVILNFRQAQAIAREWFLRLHRADNRKAGPYTVGAALDDYLLSFKGKDLANTRRRIEAIIRPDLGSKNTATLDSSQISEWLHKIADAPARLRTGKGKSQNYREIGDDDSCRRARRASANRILTILKAALNRAFENGKLSDDTAWRRVRPFPKVDAPRFRYLSVDEARKLVVCCEDNFKFLVQAALLTGARYSELAGLKVKHFDAQAGTVRFEETKAGVPRTGYLDPEGILLFENCSNGKGSDDLLFPRADGSKWKASQQARPLAAASSAADIGSVGFHDLRRTFGARMAMAGVPMAVIAEALGHADERITRRHYAHLSRSYVADTIRSAVAGLNIVESSNVTRLRAQN